MDLSSILGAIAAVFTACAAVLGGIVALMKQKTANLRTEIDAAIDANREIQKLQQQQISMLMEENAKLKDQLQAKNENPPD